MSRLESPSPFVSRADRSVPVERRRCYAVAAVVVEYVLLSSIACNLLVIALSRSMSLSELGGVVDSEEVLQLESS